MERRTFLRNLMVGLFAAPLAAKALKAEAKPVLMGWDAAKGPDVSKLVLVSNPTSSHSDWRAPWLNGNEWRFYEDGVWWGLDQKPLRFESKKK